jgi:hypothetical protein
LVVKALRREEAGGGSDHEEDEDFVGARAWYGVVGTR